MPPHGKQVVPLNLQDLFEKEGANALRYAFLCEARSGERGDLEAFVVRTHDDRQWMAIDQPGACPDCAPSPVAAMQLPGFDLPAGTDLAQPLILRGRLSCGFAVSSQGEASFLRPERACLYEGAKR